LYENAVQPQDRRLIAQSSAKQIGLGDIFGQHVLERRHAGFLGLLVLAAT